MQRQVLVSKAFRDLPEKTPPVLETKPARVSTFTRFFSSKESKEDRDAKLVPIIAKWISEETGVQLDVSSFLDALASGEVLCALMARRVDISFHQELSQRGLVPEGLANAHKRENFVVFAKGMRILRLKSRSPLVDCHRLDNYLPVLVEFSRLMQKSSPVFQCVVCSSQMQNAMELYHHLHQTHANLSQYL